MKTVDLEIEPLTKQRFAPFGDVIEIDGARPTSINEGTAVRFSRLASIDVSHAEGRPSLNIYRSDSRPNPLRITKMERHPHGSQAFVSLDHHPFVVVVSLEDTGRPTVPRVFLAAPGQGVNYRRGTWHHGLIALRSPSLFLVLDREGPGENLEEWTFEEVVYEISLEEEATPGP